MNKAKILKFSIGALLLIGLAWYLLKDYNYKITFTTTQSPGIVYDHLLKWNIGFKKDTLKTISVVEKIPLKEIKQNITVGDSLFTYRWSLKRLNDSSTLVTALIKDNNNSFNQNLTVPFKKNAFVYRSIAMVQEFGESLIQNAKNYKISKISEATIPAKNCACISLESKMDEKASTMVKNIYLVTNYIYDHNLELDGHPFLEISEWNINEDLIKFDFCFPLKAIQNYPSSPNVTIKKTTEQKALKAIFNGNYKISDRAWFALLDYAAYHDYEITGLPVEVFLNDPHAGGNDLEWVAEVFMPYK